MMKKFRRIYLLLAAIIVTAISIAWYVEDNITFDQAKSSLIDIPSPPPASLDALYPPKSEQPLYMFAMLSLDMPFTGILVDLTEEDFENVAANYQKFKEQYISVSKMVPEWESSFPMLPVEEFGNALKSGNKELIMSSAEKVGNVCQTCHVYNMAKVQQKYHWKDFQSVTVNDPVTNENVDFTQLMKLIGRNFTGLEINIQEKQNDNAKKQYEQFKKRFAALRASCTHCHATERRYYVDENIRSVIDKLGEALNKSAVDPQLVGNLNMQIGMESCNKCHLVHVPAAITKLGWKILESEKNK